MSIKNIREVIWAFIKDKQKGYPNIIKVRKKDIEESVFECEGEYRITGEEANNFSGLYVDYYDGQEIALSMMEYLRSHGWDADWYNPAYIVITLQENI